MYADYVKSKGKSGITSPSAYGWPTTKKNHLETAAIDIPQALLKNVGDRLVRAEIAPTEEAVIAGVEELERKAKTAGLAVDICVSSGMQIKAGRTVATVKGYPLQVVQGEDLLLNLIGKASGVATAAKLAARKAGKIRVVCGGWKKIPSTIKPYLRAAVEIGGAGIRMLAEPFVYLDKNYIRIFGSLSKALKTAQSIPGRKIVVQLRGETDLIEKEAITAAGLGAKVVMVDTGCIDDVRAVSRTLLMEGLRQRVQIAFAGGLRLNDLESLQQEDVDIVDIGRAILDAPLIDFRYDVLVAGS